MTEIKSRGRPRGSASFKPEFCEAARQMCEFGATNADLAIEFDVSQRTIYLWQAQFPEFREALTLGKKVADDRVERSLYQRACGYDYEAVKIFYNRDTDQLTYATYVEHVPPETTAAIFWLKNRRPDDWCDRHELTGGGGGPIMAITREMPLTEAVSNYAQLIAAEGVPIEEAQSPAEAIDKP